MFFYWAHISRILKTFNLGIMKFQFPKLQLSKLQHPNTLKMHPSNSNTSKFQKNQSSAILVLPNCKVQNIATTQNVVHALSIFKNPYRLIYKKVRFEQSVVSCILKLSMQSIRGPMSKICWKFEKSQKCQKSYLGTISKP